MFNWLFEYGVWLRLLWFNSITISFNCRYSSSCGPVSSFPNCIDRRRTSFCPFIFWLSVRICVCSIPTESMNLPSWCICLCQCPLYPSTPNFVLFLFFIKFFYFYLSLHVYYLTHRSTNTFQLYFSHCLPFNLTLWSLHPTTFSSTDYLDRLHHHHRLRLSPWTNCWWVWV